MTTQLATAAALFSGAAGFSICANEAAMQHDLPFNTPIGEHGTCGSWLYETLEQHYPMDTVERCKQKVELFFPGVAGSTSMPVMELLSFMARSKKNDGAGCCGEDIGGSVCDQFADQLHSERPCPSGEAMTRVGMAGGSWEEKCLPCYNKLVPEDRDDPNGRMDCRGCWGADASGCDDSECVGLGGMVHEGRCMLCNSASPDGCMDPASCEANGGNWWDEDRECRTCRPEYDDTYGCKEEECQGGTMRWSPEDGRCRVCDPQTLNVYGCGKEECEMLSADYPRVSYHHSYCGVCKPEDGQHHACSKEFCVPSNEMPDMKWVESMRWDDETQTDVPFGYCTRCYHDGDGDDMSGCMTQQQCESASPDFHWANHGHCQAGGEVSGCCNSCTHHNSYGCPMGACEEKGHRWSSCEERCMRHDEEEGEHCHSPTPGHGGGHHGTCGHVSQHDLDKAYAMGYTPRYC